MPRLLRLQPTQHPAAFSRPQHRQNCSTRSPTSRILHVYACVSNNSNRAGANSHAHFDDDDGDDDNGGSGDGRSSDYQGNKKVSPSASVKRREKAAAGAYRKSAIVRQYDNEQELQPQPGPMSLLPSPQLTATSAGLRGVDDSGGGGGGGGLLSRLARGRGTSLVMRRGNLSGNSRSGGGGGSAGGSSSPVTRLDAVPSFPESSNTAPVVAGDGNDCTTWGEVSSSGAASQSRIQPDSSVTMPCTQEASGLADREATERPSPTPDNAALGIATAATADEDPEAMAETETGGGKRMAAYIDPMVARLARVVSYVERELLGNPEGAAAATAVAAVHPDVMSLPPPALPSTADQPLELFSEAPMTGRLLARAAAAEAAAAARQREISSPPSADEWQLLGGPTPNPPPPSSSSSSPHQHHRVAGGGSSTDASGDNCSSSNNNSRAAMTNVADDLFRARERQQLRYKSYLRQFVLKYTEPVSLKDRMGDSGRKEEEDTPKEGKEGNSGMQLQERWPGRKLHQPHQELAQIRGQRADLPNLSSSSSAVTKSTPDADEAGEEGEADDDEKMDFREALLEEIASASDWLQLRTLLDIVTGTRDQQLLNSAAVAAFFTQTVALLADMQGQQPESQESAVYGISSKGGGGGSGDGGTGSYDEYNSLPLTSPSAAGAFGRMEAAAYGTFCSRLAAAAVAALLRRSGGGIRDQGADDAGRCGGGAVAQIAYGMGMLQIRSKKLYDAVLRASGEQLQALTARRAAAAAVTAAAAAVLTSGKRVRRSRSAFAEMAATAAAATTGGGATATPTGTARPAAAASGQRIRKSTAMAPVLLPSEHWAPSDLANLAWGVATSYGASSSSNTLGKVSAPPPQPPLAPPPPSLPLPDEVWIRALCDVSLDSFADFNPTEIWRLLWSLARLSYVPPEDWMKVLLVRIDSSLSDFDTEGLCRVIWALAALDYVPDKLWLRALVGQLHNRLRDLNAEQLLSLYGALARLGYAPRPEVGSGFHSAAVRHMPFMSGRQLAALAYYAASFERWRPGGPFLRSLARAVSPHSTALSAAEAGRLLWAWARSAPSQHQYRDPATAAASAGSATAAATASAVGNVAAQQYSQTETLPQQLEGVLLSRILDGMRSGATDGNDLSMSLWALAVLRRVPEAEWMAAWWRAAAEPRTTATFDGTCVAQSLWAAAQLRMMAGPFSVSSVYGSSNSGGGGGGHGGGDGGDGMAAAEAAVAALLSRMSGLLRSTTTANLSTTIAALADLQYRPSDAWMTLFAAEARRRLGSETMVNEDHSLIAYGFAVLGWPLEESWIKELAAGGYRRMAGMSGEALGLFLWGLSQYGWSTDSKRFWDMVFRETGTKWDSCSTRSVVLLYCAVADLMPPEMEPPLQWQRQLAKALRLRVPRPPAAALIPAALRAVAGGCLGPSLLRLRGPAAIAAATPGGLHVNILNATGGGDKTTRTRRSALDESLWSSLVYESNLFGDLGVRTGLDDVEGLRTESSTAVEYENAALEEEEEEVLGPEFPEVGFAGWGNESDPWDGGAGWGGDPSVWSIPGQGGVSEGASDAESDEEYYERLLREMYNDGAVEGLSGAAAGTTNAAGGDGDGQYGDKQKQQQRLEQQQQRVPSSESPYILDPAMRGPDPVDPYGLLGASGDTAGSGRRTAAVQASSATDGGGGDDEVDAEPFQMPLPLELADPRDHPALAAAVSELKVWWAHDVADELRWLWGFPGVLRTLPPWVRQASLARLRKMTMQRRRGR